MKKIIRNIFAFYLFKFGPVKKELEKIRSLPCILPVYDHKPSVKRFERYVKWLMNNNFEFINGDEVIAFLKGEQKLKNCKIWISLDDGWRSNIDLIPIIEKYKVPVTIFVNTAPLKTGFFRDTLEKRLKRLLPAAYQNDISKLKMIPEKIRGEIQRELEKKIPLHWEREALNKEELMQLATHPLVTIGAHTHNHVMLSRCTDGEIQFEIESNLEVLHDVLPYKVQVFSFPYGDFNSEVIEKLDKYKFGFLATIKHGKITPGANTTLIPRNGIANASFYENCCRIIDLWYPALVEFRKKMKII